MNRHLHVGPGGIRCRCCLPPRGSKARRIEFRRAKRREARAHFAAQDDESGWYCAMGCGRLIEERECGPYCMQCRWFAEDYEAMLSDEFERDYVRSLTPPDHGHDGELDLYGYP